MLAEAAHRVIGALAPRRVNSLRRFMLGILDPPSKMDARSISQRFIDWFAHRRPPGRPFFAFLNYYDAHTAYLLPRGAKYRFGRTPRTQADLAVFVSWPDLDKLVLPRHFRELARDCYDSCIAYLDEQLGELFDALAHRGELNHTLVIVTSDHGEGFSEHDLFFHGESLYRTEIHVPLLFVLPSGSRPQVVKHTVGLRDLPATVVDLVGLEVASPFPGRSLARLWRDPAGATDPEPREEVISELANANPINPNQGRSPAREGPLISLADDEFVYIRNERSGAGGAIQ